MHRNLALMIGGWLLAAAMGQAKTVEVVPDASESWTPAQIELVKRAAEVVDERMGKIETNRCAYRNSWRGLPKDEDWGRAMGVFRRQRTLRIIIGKGSLENKVLAQARVGQGAIDARQDQWKDLRIEFNERRLKATQDADPRTVDFWAATIAHELAHNMGLRHGSRGDDWEENYAGYFVTELGYCVISLGRTGSDKGDVSLRKERIRRFKLDW